MPFLWCVSTIRYPAGRDWSEELPTDAAVVMRLFVCCSDDLLPRQWDKDRPFARQHLVDRQPCKSDALPGRLAWFLWLILLVIVIVIMYYTKYVLVLIQYLIVDLDTGAAAWRYFMYRVLNTTLGTINHHGLATTITASGVLYLVLFILVKTTVSQDTNTPIVL